jgi:hypothetical protein
MVVEALVCCVIGDNNIISGFRKYNCRTGLKKQIYSIPSLQAL